MCQLERRATSAVLLLPGARQCPAVPASDRPAVSEVGRGNVKEACRHAASDLGSGLGLAPEPCIRWVLGQVCLDRRPSARLRDGQSSCLPCTTPVPKMRQRRLELPRWLLLQHWEGGRVQA